MTTAPAPQWRCYCPISLCRLLDPYGIWHALAYVRGTCTMPRYTIPRVAHCDAGA